MSCMSYTSPLGLPQEPSTGMACPYSICREGITRYLLRQVNPFAYTLLAFLALQAGVLIGNAVMYWRMRLLLRGQAGSGFNEALLASGVAVDERDLVRVGEEAQGGRSDVGERASIASAVMAAGGSAGGARRGMEDGRGDAFLPPQTLEEEELQIREALFRSELEGLALGEGEAWEEGSGRGDATAEAGEATGAETGSVGSVGHHVLAVPSIVGSALDGLGFIGQSIGASLGVTTVSSPTSPSPPHPSSPPHPTTEL